MRIRILTMGMFVLCLSVFFFFAISSEATTDDQLVINALRDLDDMENAIIEKRLDVNDKWSLVDLVSPKWDAVVDANRYNSTTNYVIDLMGSGFWAIAAGLAGQTEEAFKSYYKNVSLMGLYSSTLNDVKSEISWFYEVTVKLYNSAHTNAQNTVNTHHTNYHTSSSETPHTVSSWSKKTCRDSLPSFLCRGNHFASGTCAVSYDTPSDAYYTHQLRCGSESASVPAGDGIIYYSCDEVGYALHTDRICVKTYTNSRGVSSPCGVKYRRCMDSKRDHDESDIWPFESAHSDTAESSTENPVVSPPPTPTPPSDGTPNCPDCTSHCSSPCSCSTSGTCDGTMVTAACGVHTIEPGSSSEHSHRYISSCSETENGNTCTNTSGYYACSPHSHTYPAMVSCAAGHSYREDHPNRAYLDNLHRPRECRFSGCGNSWHACSISGGVRRAIMRIGKARVGTGGRSSHAVRNTTNPFQLTRGLSFGSWRVSFLVLGVLCVLGPDPTYGNFDAKGCSVCVRACCRPPASVL